MPYRQPASLTRFNRRTLPLLAAAVRGGRALRDVRTLVDTDRWNSFDRFHDTTGTLLRLYEEAGAGTEVASIPTGGALGSGRWIIRESQDIVSATVDIITPARRRIVDYASNPWQVVQWTAATPREGIRCQLRIYDDETSIRQARTADIAGRAILTRGQARNLLPLLAEKGALALITDRAVPENPGATGWTKFGWGAIPLESGGGRIVGLVLSDNAGRRLRGLAARGDVTLEIKVDTRLYQGTHDLVSGIVPGCDDPQDELWVLAHSAEPGAHDNASGVAVCVEAARAIEALVRAGRIPRPKRTLRFLNGFECYSFFHHIEHARRFQTPLAGVCVDTVGARPDICGGRLSWRATVPSSAGFVDRIGASVLRSTLRQIQPGYRLTEGDFVSTSDTLAGDPRYGFPCPWVSTHYRKANTAWAAYHSSADVPALLSPRGLAAVAAGTAGYLLYLANLETADVVQIAESETRLAAAGLTRRTPGDTAELLRARHRESLRRLRRFLWGGDGRSAVARLGELEDEIRASGPRPAPPSKAAGLRRVPHRTRALTPTLENTPADLAKRIRASGLSPWALFWADGRRTLGDILPLLRAEYGKHVAPEQVAGFFEAHAALGYARLTSASEIVTKRRLVGELRAIGLRAGMNVMIHSSLSAVGHVEGGPDTVLDAVLQVIGRRGTLLMPSFNHRGARVYNPLATPSTNGALPDAFWRRPGVVRSLHATHAVAAFGPRAEAWTEGHLESGCWTADSPLARFVRDGGYVLSIGVGHNSSTVYHVGEMAVPCGCNDPFGVEDRVVNAEGKVETVAGLAFRNGRCPVPPDRLDAALRRARKQTAGRIGNADATLCLARDIYETRIRHLASACPSCPIKPRYESRSR